MALSVVIHTKNAAETLARALQSVSFADEIIVIDMESQDETIAIARKHRAKIYDHPDLGFADPARNFGLDKASHDWILVLDADEEIPVTLRHKILQITAGEKPAADAYYLPRKNLIFNQWIEHTGWWPDYQIRLFKAGTVRWTDEVHQLPDISGTSAHLPAEEELAIVHHNYQTVEEFIDRLNRYTSIKAKSLAGQKASRQKPTAASLTATFSQEFFNRFFAHQGVSDGAHGLSLSLLQAMYELVVRLKVWQVDGFPETVDRPQRVIKQWRQFQGDLAYWLADWQYQHTSGLVRLWWQCRRKLRI